MAMALVAPKVTARPDYTIRHYNDTCYKVVKYRRSAYDDGFGKIKAESQAHAEKLDNSLSRARSRVFELAACNPWEWFFTGTLDSSKADRFDLNSFRSKLSEWMRNRRKAYGTKLAYLIVPEFHADGAIHVHGFLSGIPVDRVQPFQRYIHPAKLVDGGFFNWPDYSKRFGFCSLGRIKNRAASAFYICKYISKDLCTRRADLGSHLFYATQGLQSSDIWGDCYGDEPALNSLITRRYDFCEVGWATRNVDWTFGGDMQGFVDNVDLSGFVPLYDETPEFESFAAEMAEYEQCVMGACEWN